jgi:DNA-binding winged helix-turn-helix (wHTH) protein
MRRIQFGDFEVDMELFTLKHRGSIVEIGKRTLDLLIYLVQNRDRVVDTEQLRQEVWKSAALSAAAIPTCVRELRRALGDDATDPSFVESTRGRGYRFIADVQHAPLTKRDTSTLLEELPFAGRRAELTILRRILQKSISQASGSLIIIRGEAGMGKSRLLSEFLKTVPLRASRFVVRCSNIEGTPAFWPWTHVLREALTSTDAENRDLIESAQRLAVVFPEILGSIDSGFERTSKLDRFSIFSQWAEAIRSISKGNPLVLVFEDIHRTDFDSLALLSWISQELTFDPIILLATHRPSPSSDAIAQALADIADVHNSICIDLTPLTSDDISVMIDPLDVDRSILSKELGRRTSGNPFYITHLVRYLDSRSNLGPAESLILNLPANGREIVSRQLSDLAPDTREVLAVASVEGVTFSIAATAELIGTGTRKLISLLEPARRAWLIREDGAHFVFRHALLREALYQTIELSKRRKIHHRLARMKISRADSHSNAGRISDDLESAKPISLDAEIKRFALFAGRQSASRFAFSDAQIFFRRALDAIEGDIDNQVPDRCQIMLEYADSQLHSGDRDGARATLLETARLSRRFGSTAILAACALNLAPDYLSIEVGEYDPILVDLLEEALGAVHAEDSSLRARLLARLSLAIQCSDNPLRQSQMTQDALTLARESQDDGAIGAALSARAEYLRGPASAEDRVAVLDELSNLKNPNTNILDQLVDKTRLISALLEIGDLVRLDAENELSRELASSTGLPHFMWYPESTDSMRALMKGDNKTNLKLAERHSQVQRLTNDANVTQGFGGQEIFRHVELDHGEEMLPMVTEFARVQKLVLTWPAALAWIQWDTGHISEARTSIAKFGPNKVKTLLRQTGGGIGIAALAEVSAAIGERASCAFLLSLLKPIRNRCATAGYGVLYFGSFCRYSGLLAASLDLYQEAIDDLERAVSYEGSRKAPVWKAYAEIDLARTLHQSGASRDRVISALMAARRTSDESNSPRLARRLRVVAEHVELSL